MGTRPRHCACEEATRTTSLRETARCANTGGLDEPTTHPTDVFDSLSASRHGPDDQKRLGACRNRLGQRGIRRLVGESCSQAKNRRNGRRCCVM